MRIKRIKKLQVNNTIFKVVWKPNINEGASYDYTSKEITFTTLGQSEEDVLMLVCHELFEVCAYEMGVAFTRPDCPGDRLFSFDHRQHTTIQYMFSGLLFKFLA